MFNLTVIGESSKSPSNFRHFLYDVNTLFYNVLDFNMSIDLIVNFMIFLYNC